MSFFDHVGQNIKRGGVEGYKASFINPFEIGNGYNLLGKANLVAQIAISLLRGLFAVSTAGISEGIIFAVAMSYDKSSKVPEVAQSFLPKKPNDHDADDSMAVATANTVNGLVSDSLQSTHASSASSVPIDPVVGQNTYQYFWDDEKNKQLLQQHFNQIEIPKHTKDKFVLKNEVESNFSLNVKLLRQNAVQVKVQGKVNYMHANRIDMNGIRYVMTQYPHYPLNKEQFWTLALESDQEYIVDLSNRDELTNPKYTKFPLQIYYPEQLDQTVTFGEVKVTLVEKVNMVGKNGTKFGEYAFYEIVKGDTKKIISRINLNIWEKDKDVDLSSLDDVLDRVDDVNNPLKDLIVHDTAGTGRSSTFMIALSLKRMMQKGELTKENYIQKVKELTLKLRNERNDRCIRSPDQLKVLLKYAEGLTNGVFIKPKFKATHPKIKKQFTFNLGSGASAIGLASKAEYRYNLETTRIDLRPQNPDLNKLKEIDNETRIYIIGHCGPGLSYIQADGQRKVTVQEYANMIQSAYNPNPESQSKLKVSCVACYAGGGNDEYKETNPAGNPDPNMSFACQLSQELDKRGIPAIVHGRTAPVARFHTQINDPRKYQKKTIHYYQPIYRQKGSKMVFETINGETTVTTHIWK